MMKAHNKFAKNVTKIKIETENGDKQKKRTNLFTLGKKKSSFIFSVNEFIKT